MAEIDFIPPVETYGHTGNPYKFVYDSFQTNTAKQNTLNTKHGGAKNNTPSKKRVIYGGDADSLITIPQAPTLGGIPAGPNTGNHLAKIASELLVNGKAQSQYDSLVGQKGGTLKSKLKGLLGRKKKRNTKRNNKKKRNTKRNNKKKRNTKRINKMKKIKGKYTKKNK
jgi:hypothetical protein